MLPEPGNVGKALLPEDKPINEVESHDSINAKRDIGR